MNTGTAATPAPRIRVSIACFCTVLLCVCASAEDSRIAVEGVTRPFRDEIISSLVPGKIETIRFREGDTVKEGDVLFELEKKMHELEVKRRQLIYDSKVTVKAAEARVRTLKMDLDSTRRIYESTKSISREEVEKKELEHELAVADLDQATLDELREEIELQQAVEQVRMRIISSPLNGVVVTIPRDVGENCQPHEPLARIVDTGKCYFVANVDARLVKTLAVGNEVELQILSGNTSVNRTGTVCYISPVVDPASGLQQIKAVFDNTDGSISPGIGGTVFIPTN